MLDDHLSWRCDTELNESLSPPRSLWQPSWLFLQCRWQVQLQYITSSENSVLPSPPHSNGGSNYFEVWSICFLRVQANGNKSLISRQLFCLRGFWRYKSVRGCFIAQTTHPLWVWGFGHFTRTHSPPLPFSLPLLIAAAGVYVNGQGHGTRGKIYHDSLSQGVREVPCFSTEFYTNPKPYD